MKEFNELFFEIEEDQEIKEAWQNALTEQKKSNKNKVIVISIIIVLIFLLFTNIFKKFFFNEYLYIIYGIVMVITFISIIIYINATKEKEKTIKNNLQNALAEQKGLKKDKWVAAFMCVLLFIFYFFLKNLSFAFYDSVNGFSKEILYILSIVFLIFFMSIIIFNSIGKENQKQSEYKNIFKQKIIKRILRNFYDDLEYFPEKEMPAIIYDRAEYKEFYNRYYSEDYFKCKLQNKYNISMAEILTEYYEESVDSEGNKTTSITIKFSGLFATTVIDKSIKSNLRIILNKLGKYDKNKINMDSKEFEKYFDVVATDKIIAMQLLTPDIMEEMINFRNNFNLEYEIVIRNNEIYLRFHSGELFEPRKLKKGIISKEDLEKYYNLIKFTYDLLNKLIKTIYETEI